MTVFTISRQKFDIAPIQRVAIAILAGAIFALSAYGFVRWVIGAAPPTPWVKGTALAIHISTAMLALPLGAYLFLVEKGSKRHKALGYVWLGLMMTTAVATIFIRNINDGQFSWIHLFTLLTFVAVPQAIVSARRGCIAGHRRHLRNFFLGALVVAGAFTFLPGRTMWQWAFGDPSQVQPSHE